ncbi:MAG TPA: cell division protein ZapA [Clostridiaceae bacterium]|nr:cell division protein ZapA [Clostridiaceae bacterium]
MEIKNKVTIKIAGTEYTVKGSEPEEYIHKLGFFVDKKMTQIMEKNSMLSTCMAAVLTALNIADDYMKAEEKNKALQDELEKTKKELAALKEENERISAENKILVSSNTQLQLELSKSESELREARKTFERFSNRNEGNKR